MNRAQPKCKSLGGNIMKIFVNNIENSLDHNDDSKCVEYYLLTHLKGTPND